MPHMRASERGEERDDVKRGKFLGLSLRRLDLALTKDYEGEGQIDREKRTKRRDFSA